MHSGEGPCAPNGRDVCLASQRRSSHPTAAPGSGSLSPSPSLSPPMPLSISVGSGGGQLDVVGGWPDVVGRPAGHGGGPAGRGGGWPDLVEVGWMKALRMTTALYRYDGSSHLPHSSHFISLTLPSLPFADLEPAQTTAVGGTLEPVRTVAAASRRTVAHGWPALVTAIGAVTDSGRTAPAMAAPDARAVREAEAGSLY